jgi:hypothetical protein
VRNAGQNRLERVMINPALLDILSRVERTSVSTITTHRELASINLEYREEMMRRNMVVKIVRDFADSVAEKSTWNRYTHSHGIVTSCECYALTYDQLRYIAEQCFHEGQKSASLMNMQFDLDKS